MTPLRAVAVFGSSQTKPGSPRWVDAERLGARCADAGLGVITGGYGGTMEAVSRGASMGGGDVVGVTVPTLFKRRTGPNRYVTREIQVPSLIERIGTLIGEATGVIVLPGSIGTAAELVVSWNLNHVARRNEGRRIPTVAVGDEWRDLGRLLVKQMGAFDGDVHIVDTTEAALDWILAQPEFG